MHSDFQIPVVLCSAPVYRQIARDLNMRAKLPARALDLAAIEYMV